MGQGFKKPTIFFRFNDVAMESSPRPTTGPPGRRPVPAGWEQMQRRIARKAGQVAAFQERPRLLAAAEDPEVHFLGRKMSLNAIGK